MTVNHLGVVEHPTGTTRDTNDPHTFTATPPANSKSLLLFVESDSPNATDTNILGATFGGVAMSRVAIARDSAGEAGSLSAYFLADITGRTGDTVSIDKNVGGIGTWAVAIFNESSIGGTLEATGAVLLEGDGTVAEQNVTDGSPGTSSQRYAAGHTGLAAPPPVGANSTLLGDIDLGQEGAAACRRTTAGQGSLAVGFSSATSDDRAYVHIAVREVAAGTAWDPGTIADALGITDSVSFVIGRGCSVNDALAITDAQTFGRGLSQADALGMTDSVSSAGAFARNVDDALAVTDGVVAGLLFPVAVNDALAVTDAVRMDVALAIADAAGITDAAALGQSKAFADALGMTDSAAPIILKLVAVDDALAITDNLTSVAVLARSVDDALAITDSLSSSAALARTVADSIAITDAVAFVREVALADALGLTDAQAFAVALSLADALGLVDAATPAGGYLRTVADDVGITDAITPLWTPGVAPAYIDLGAVLTLELDSIVRTLELAGRTATLELDATERGVELDDTTRGFDLDG